MRDRFLHHEANNALDSESEKEQELRELNWQERSEKKLLRQVDNSPDDQ